MIVPWVYKNSNHIDIIEIWFNLSKVKQVDNKKAWIMRGIISRVKYQIIDWEFVKLTNWGIIIFLFIHI
jgi:hypothetical protein